MMKATLLLLLIIWRFSLLASAADMSIGLDKFTSGGGAEIVTRSADNITVHIPASTGWPQLNMILKTGPDLSRYNCLKFRADVPAELTRSGWNVSLFYGDRKIGGYFHQAVKDSKGFFSLELPALPAGSLLKKIMVAFKSPKVAGQVKLSNFILVKDAEEKMDRVNIAAGKKVKFDQPPDYPLCTDPQDPANITDGKWLKRDTVRMWTIKESVGWRMLKSISWTLDLGNIQEIDEIKYHTGAGVPGGVKWPLAVYVLGSSDNKQFYLLGEMMKTNQLELPDDVVTLAQRWLVLKDLNTKLRYIKFVIKVNGFFHFVDEVEVFGGERKDFKKLSDYPRLSDDVKKAEVMLDAFSRAGADLDIIINNAKARKITIGRELADLRRKTDDNSEFFLKQRDTVSPMNLFQEELLKINRKIIASGGNADKLIVWKGGKWDNCSIYSLPDRIIACDFNLYLLKNEKTGRLLNITNPALQPLVCKVSSDGKILSRIYQVVSMVSNDNFLNSNLLKPLDCGAEIPVPSGGTVQLWLEFSGGNEAGNQKFTVRVNDETIPVTAQVSELVLPDKLSCSLGFWDYINNLPSAYPGVTAENFEQVSRILADYQVDWIWGGVAVVPWPGKGCFNQQDELVGEIDFKPFIEWVERFPDKQLVVFNYRFQAGELDGIKYADNPDRFNKRAGACLNAWGKFLENRDWQRKIIIHFVDEAGNDASKRLFSAWCRALGKSTLSKYAITYFNPRIVPDERQNYSDADVLASIYEYSSDKMKHLMKISAERPATGSMSFYSCQGNSRSLDAQSYYGLPIRSGILFRNFSGVNFWALCGAPDSLNEYAYDKLIFSPLYFDGNKVFGSRQMQAIYEARVWYEYFIMLEKAVSELPDSDAEKVKYAKLLQKIRQDVLAEVDRVAHLRKWESNYSKAGITQNKKLMWLALNEINRKRNK